MSKNNLTRRGLLQRALVGGGCSLVALTKPLTGTPIATNPKVQSEMSATQSLEHCGKCLENITGWKDCSQCSMRPPIGTRLVILGKNWTLVRKC